MRTTPFIIKYVLCNVRHVTRCLNILVASRKRCVHGVSVLLIRPGYWSRDLKSDDVHTGVDCPVRRPRLRMITNAMLR